MADARPPFPADSLRAALPPGDAAHSTIDDLHGELGSDSPDAAAIAGHVETLRGHNSLGAIVQEWFDDPRTQSFIQELTAAGL